ncbi:exocyst complex component 6B [Trichonephila clavipes]|nr:exocyst complex component 6B [Trichonephila clavipes]
MAEDVSNDSSYNAASRNPHSEHELLLYELETSDTSSVGLVVRAIYEGDEYEKFMERLDARIKNHDRDIERMCNFHYQGFIDSIRELLQVRTKAQKLKCLYGKEYSKKPLSCKSSLRLVEGKDRWEAPDHPLDVFSQS